MLTVQLTPKRGCEGHRGGCRGTVRARVWSVRMCQEEPVLDQMEDLCLRCAKALYEHKKSDGFAWWTQVVQVRPYRTKERSRKGRSWGRI